MFCNKIGIQDRKSDENYDNQYSCSIRYLLVDYLYECDCVHPLSFLYSPFIHTSSLYILLCSDHFFIQLCTLVSDDYRLILKQKKRSTVTFFTSIMVVND